jgi:hypothetical protein
VRSCGRQGGNVKGKQLLLLGMLSGSIVMGALFSLLGYENTWRLWNIGPMPLPFADLRAITGASESLASGLDPLVRNPGDPWGRTVNYPRVWLLLSSMVDQRNTVFLGITFAALFLIGVLLSSPGGLDRSTAAVLVVSVFSPAVLFGIERGNTDLLVFFLVSIAVYSSNRQGTVGRAVGIASILVGFVLKLYPIFALIYLLREDRRTFYRLSLGAALLAGLYLALSYRDLRLILQHLPLAKDFAFGIDVWANRVFPLVGTGLRIPIYAVLAAGLFLALPSQVKGNGASNPVQEDGLRKESIDAFRIGGSIYLGTFLMGSNYDYKLAFLLLTLPQLMSWARSAIGPMARTARWTLVGVIVSTWAPLLREPLALVPLGSTLGFLLDELADWAVFLGLAFLLVSSAPKWLWNDANHVLRTRTTRSGSFILLTSTSAVLATGALAYLALLPSDLSRAVLGRYSLSRLILMSGPLLASLVFASLLGASARDSGWASRAADRVYGSRWLVQRLGACGLALAAALLLLIAILQPEWTERVTSVTIQRLLPYFVLPSAYLGMYWVTDRISHRQDRKLAL